MALTRCRECAHEVAKSATTCPNCGVKNPGKGSLNIKIGTKGAGCLAIIIIVWILASLTLSSDPQSNVTTSAPDPMRRWVWSAANVREGRGTNTPVVRTLAAGTEIGVLNAENNWWEVYIAGRQIGFISNSVIHRAPAATARQTPSQPSRRSGATHVTVENYVACVSRADFDEQFDLAMNDLQAWRRFMGSSSCVVTRAGVPIFRRNARGLGVIQIRVEGETTWIFTVSEAARMR